MLADPCSRVGGGLETLLVTHVDTCSTRVVGVDDVGALESGQFAARLLAVPGAFPPGRRSLGFGLVPLVALRFEGVQKPALLEVALGLVGLPGRCRGQR
jgi:hypothetical protein